MRKPAAEALSWWLFLRPILRGDRVLPGQGGVQGFRLIVFLGALGLRAWVSGLWLWILGVLLYLPTAYCEEQSLVRASSAAVGAYLSQMKVGA